MQHSFLGKKNLSGFTLIQVSVLLAVASLTMVAVLPSSQAPVVNNQSSSNKLNTVLSALRQYETVYGVLPCPADPTLPMGNGNYGIAATNGGTTGNCMGGTPAAAYADTTNHIAIGMVPVKTLGLTNDAALDGYGRDITYAVDTNATSCWTTTSLSGSITVSDNSNNQSTVAVLVSHGMNGYGAWLPLNAGSGTGVRLNSGSMDTSEAANAQVTAGTLTANGTFASFVRKPFTNTFDDEVTYRSPFFSLNQQSILFQNLSAVVLTPPANAIYTPGTPLQFTLTFPVSVTVSGTPRLDITANAGGNTYIGTNGTIAYANYISGSGTNTLRFQYIVSGSDLAPNGIVVTPPVDLNGGAISYSNLCFPLTNLPYVYLLPEDEAGPWWAGVL